MKTKVKERRKMVDRGSGSMRLVTTIVVALAMLAISASAYAAGTDEEVPATSIVPSGGESGAAPSKSPASVKTPVTTSPARSKPAVHHRSTRATVHETEVEPAQAR